MFQQYRSLLPYRSLLALMVLIGCAPEITTPKYTTEPNWTAENPLASRGASAGSSRIVSRAAISSSLDALQKGESTATPASSPLKDIHFEFDRYELRADAREALDANAKWLKEHPSVRVEIEGHCDERGTNEYNMGLGAKRAQAARDYLVSLEISGSTIVHGKLRRGNSRMHGTHGIVLGEESPRPLCHYRCGTDVVIRSLMPTKVH